MSQSKKESSEKVPVQKSSAVLVSFAKCTFLFHLCWPSCPKVLHQWQPFERPWGNPIVHCAGKRLSLKQVKKKNDYKILPIEQLKIFMKRCLEITELF